jgi:2-hydroxychromene-2-carboxylate isomerase
VSAAATFYFDFNSPYAYLAAERIEGLIPDAEWKPIAFPIVLHQLGRLEEAMRRDTAPILAEVRRRAAERGLPEVTHPAGWPNHAWSLAPLRAAVFAGQRGRAPEFSRAAFRKAFAEGTSLAEPAHVSDVAATADLDPGEVAEAIERQDIKDRLKQNTEEALAAGVTGIPTIAIGDELYWGDDRLEEAAAALSSRPSAP